MKYVLSTMTNSVAYAFYTTPEGRDGVPAMREKITIFGGANIPSLRSGFGEMANDDEGRPIWMADGIVTAVEDSKFEILENHKLFKDHMAAGYLKVVKDDITGNHKAVKKHVVAMEKNDTYSLMTPARANSMVKVKKQEMEADTKFRL